MNPIGEKIRKLRQNKHWTQQELAEKCSFPGLWTVSRLETRVYIEEESPGGEQVFMELPFNDRGQGIDAISESGPAADYVNAGERTGISVSKHSAPP